MPEIITLPCGAAARARTCLLRSGLFRNGLPRARLLRTCLLITSLTLPHWAAASAATGISAPGADLSATVGARADKVAPSAVSRPEAAPSGPHVGPGPNQGATPSAASLATGTGPFGAAAAQDQLERTRGGADAIASDTRLQGSVGNNSASHMTTGANRIETGSFTGAVGLPVVIQNSGANVLIQNATVINLQLK